MPGHTIKMAAIRALSNCRVRLARCPGVALRMTVNQLSQDGSCARYTERELSISCPVQANEVSKNRGAGSSEIERSLEAAKSKKDNLPTIFSKIINKEVPANIVYEDDVALAFEDVNPQTPCHVLVIPKKHIAMLSDVEEHDKDLLGHLMVVANRVAHQKELKDGFRVVINCGEHGGQSIYHLHLHVLGGIQMGWPPL